MLRISGRSTAGFTLIEMIAVVVVIMILAGLAFAKLQSQKEKATVAAMTSDMRAIAEEQEAYYFQNRLYTSDLVALNWRASPGDTLVIEEATAAGWSGRIYNPKTTKQCYIVVGSAALIGSAVADGVIRCS